MKPSPQRIIILKIAFIAWLLTGISSYCQTLEAHPLNNGYSQFIIDKNTVEVDLFIPEPSMLQYDLNADKQLDTEELKQQTSSMTNYLSDHLQLRNGQKPMALELLSVERAEKETIPGIAFKLNFTGNSKIESLTIQYSLLFDDYDPNHINFAIIMNGNDVDQTIWNAENRTYHYEPFQQDGLWPSLWLYFTLGIEHILSGTDHLLFLFALLLITSKASDILKIVTAFTVAHSITLFLAASNIISVRPTVVESAIALTIAYVAVENLVVKEAGKRWVLTFLFGLIHGMGFAGALKEVGLPQDYFVSSLLSFNVGVEMGQMAVVLVILPILLKLSKLPWYRRLVYAGSGVIILIALKLFAERIGWLS
jgi:hydrogenase/urease accessory protein HupE